MILVILVGLVLILAAALGMVWTQLRVERRGAQRPATGEPASPRAEPASARAQAAPPPAAPVSAGAQAAPPLPAGDPLPRPGTSRTLLGLLAHEMRTPLGAIIGYGELLGDGLLGEMPERAADAVRRMETAGGQLRHLIDGLADLMISDDEVVLELDDVDTTATARVLAASAQALAGGRGVQLDIIIPEDLPVLRADGARLAAALDLAVGAAIRASPGATLRLRLSGDHGGLAVRVEGTALDPARDLPLSGDENAVSTGAGLRLLMATRMLHLLDGGVRIEGVAPATLLVWVPPGSIDGSVSGP